MISNSQHYCFSCLERMGIANDPLEQKARAPALLVFSLLSLPDAWYGDKKQCYNCGFLIVTNFGSKLQARAGNFGMVISGSIMFSHEPVCYCNAHVMESQGVKKVRSGSMNGYQNVKLYKCNKCGKAVLCDFSPEITDNTPEDIYIP